MPFSGCGICQYVISNTVTLADHFANKNAAYPITCSTTDTTTTLGLRQLFKSQDLIEAIVGQAVSLWIIGSIMQDFLTQAPDIARDLTGRLQFAAALGG